MQPPLLIGAMAKNADTQRELINYAMICSGIFTMVHVCLPHLAQLSLSNYQMAPY